MKAVFLPEAEEELLAQIKYYEDRKPGLGARYVAEVMAALDYVVETPHRFPVIRKPALRRLGLKRFPFAIYFRELDSVVQVVAIAPHRRQPAYWRDRF